LNKHFYEDLHLRLGVSVANDNLGAILQNALELSWTRDPFDRLIVAHTAARSTLLLTADLNILKNTSLAVW
jgi:PIN domain nuclease of toxin-antitoxin system